MKPSLVVMAAGIGSRYGGLKQIDPIGPNGELIIDYSLYDALKAGFRKVVFIVRKEIEEAFREKVSSLIEKRMDVTYVYQELDKIPKEFNVPEGRIKPWGTGHAILCSREVLNSNFAVINADDFYGQSSYDILYRYLRDLRDTDTYNYCLVGYVLENALSAYGHVARGVCSVSKDGFLTGVVEKTKIVRVNDRIISVEQGREVELARENIVSLNTWGFTPSLISQLDRRFYRFLDKNINNPKAEYFIPTVIDELLREGKASVKVLPTKEKWFGVTYREDIPKMKEAIREFIHNGIYPERLWR